MPTRMLPVSIGLPVRNGENFLSRSLDSLLGQTFADFELIIGDNDSSDKTEQICRDYAAKDERIRYIRHDRDLGAIENFNLIAGLATGKYFKWAAHDDIYAPEYLEKCFRALEADPDVILCHSRTALIDRHGDRLRFDPKGQCYVGELGDAQHIDSPNRKLDSAAPHERFHAILHQTRRVSEIFGLMRREALPRTNMMKSFFGSDKTLLAELVLKGRFHIVPEDLFFLRCHSAQSSAQTLRTRGRFISGSAQRSVRLMSALTYREIGRVIANAEIGPVEKLRCLRSWLGLAMSRNTLRKIFMPGRDNVFGIELRMGR